MPWRWTINLLGNPSVVMVNPDLFMYLHTRAVGCTTWRCKRVCRRADDGGHGHIACFTASCIHDRFLWLVYSPVILRRFACTQCLSAPRRGAPRPHARRRRRVRKTGLRRGSCGRNSGERWEPRQGYSDIDTPTNHSQVSHNSKPLSEQILRFANWHCCPP